MTGIHKYEQTWFHARLSLALNLLDSEFLWDIAFFQINKSSYKVFILEIGRTLISSTYSSEIQISGTPMWSKSMANEFWLELSGRLEKFWANTWWHLLCRQREPLGLIAHQCLHNGHKIVLFENSCLFSSFRINKVKHAVLNFRTY